jgi:predicted ATP-grasp superfamily ATP-dependent carboligase
MSGLETYHTPAIVCDADKLSQVAIIQELGRLGVPVVAVAATSRAIGFGSKYAGRRILCSIPSYDPAFVRFLVTEVPRGVVFYSNDANTENISRHREELRERGFSLFISDIATLERVVEKDRLYQTGQECGVAVPKCALVSSTAELEDRVTEFGLPLILKSTNLAGGIYRFVRYRDDVPSVFREMTQIIESEALRHRSARLMAQQWVAQDHARLWNFNGCAKTGKILSFSMGQRIRTEVRPDGTLGSVLLFGRTAYNGAIFEENRRLLDYLKYDGIVETEWSQCTETGRTYLYDFNPRPSGNIHWAFKSGVSLAEQYYRLALGLAPKRQVMKDKVVYAKVLYRQSDWLEALSSPHRSFVEKMGVLRDDLMALAGCGRHAVDVLDPRDMGPTFRAVAELKPMLADSLQRAAHRFTQRWSLTARHARQASQASQ